MKRFIAAATICLLILQIEEGRSLPTGLNEHEDEGEAGPQEVREGGPQLRGGGPQDVSEGGPQIRREAGAGTTFPVKGEGLREAEDDKASGGRQVSPQAEGESSGLQSSRIGRQAALIDMRSSGYVPVVYLKSSSGKKSKSKGSGSQGGRNGQGQQQQGGRSGQGQQQQGGGSGQGQQQQAGSRGQGQQQLSGQGQQQADAYMSQGQQGMGLSGGFGANYPRSGIGGYPTYNSGTSSLGAYSGLGRSTDIYLGFG